MQSPSRITKRPSDAKINLRISFTSADLKDARWRPTQEEGTSACAGFIFCSWKRAQTGASEKIWIDPVCSSFLFPDYTGQNPFILSNVWGWNGLHTGNHKVWGKLMVGDVFHAVCIILPHDVFLLSWDMTFMNSTGWCLHANTRGFFAGLWEFVFFTAHSPLRLFKAMRYCKIINSNKLWW